MEQIRRIMRPTDVPDTGNEIVQEKKVKSIRFVYFKVYYAICYGMYLRRFSRRSSEEIIFFSFFRSDPDKDTQGWGENDRGVSFTFGADVVAKVRRKDMEIVLRIQAILVLKST